MSGRWPIALWAILTVALGLTVAWFWRLDTGIDVFIARGDGPASEVLARQLDADSGAADALLVLVDAGPRTRAAAATLTAALGGLPSVGLVADRATPGLLAEADVLYRYRYLLSDRIDRASFSVPRLRQAFRRLADDLRDPASAVNERRAAADPTGEFDYLLSQWLGDQPRDGNGWHTADGRAVLLVLPDSAAYALDEQSALIDAIHSVAAKRTPAAQLTITGAPAIAVATRDAIRSDVRRITLIAGVGVGLLVLVALRGAGALLIAALPVASGTVVALAAVLVLFGSIHGITLGFGGLLLGVTIDYPLHLLMRARTHGESLRIAAARVQRPLMVGAGSSALGLLAMAFSGITGLQQLAVFTVSGILVALAVTIRVLPGLPFPGKQRRSRPLARRVLPARRACSAFALVLVLASIGGGAWALTRLDTAVDLTGLSPLPERLVRLDGRIRRALELPEPRYLVAISGRQAAVMTTTERASDRLRALAKNGTIERYRSITGVVPSRKTQRARRTTLPAPAALRARIDRATTGLALDAAAFDPFVKDVRTTRSLPWLRPAAVDKGLLGVWLGGLMVHRGEEWTSLIRLSGVQDPALVDQALHGVTSGGAQLATLDVRAEVERMVGRYQRTAIRYSLIGAGLMLLLIVAGTGSIRAAVRALAVIITGVGAALLLLALLGETLSLFHLCSLLLIAGLALDYALFTRGSGSSASSTTLCAASTVVAFGALATATTPVLHGIGITVVAGVAASWLVATLSMHRGEKDV